MGLIRKIKRKHFLYLLLTGLFMWGLLSAGYIYRFRKMHIASSSSYKEDIESLQRNVEELEEDIAGLEEQEDNLLGDLEALKNNIVSQSEYITNGASQNYHFSLAPEEISLNQTQLSVSDSDEPHRMIAAGHIYGSPDSEKRNSIPSQTLIDALPILQESNPDLFISLGDMAYIPSHQAFQDLERAFLSQIAFPFINAPGNHDLSNGRELYENYFGQTFFYTKYSPSQIVVLDSEIANCYIVGRQKEMLEEAVELAIHDEDIKYIFVFLHKLIFLDQDTPLRNRTNGNCYFRTNYDEIREEILLPAAQEKPIYLIAGDVGAFGGNLSPFYAQDNNNQLYTIAIGLGDSEKDALLQIDLYPDKPTFELIPLGNRKFLPLESYSPEYWIANE